MRADSKQNTLVMTMGSSGYQYGYSRYYANYGEIEGELTHDGKAVTLVMLCYYSGYLDLAFNVDGVTSGSYNVTVNVPSDLSRFFTAANVGKKYKIEIVFN